MVKSIQIKDKKIYKCNVCGFGYLTSKLANECEAYCKAHSSCSLEITKHAVIRG